MAIFNRPTLMKIHAILAAFILPVAIMYFVTGALYTWSIKGAYESSTHEFHVENPIQADLDELVILAENELSKRELSLPSGKAKIKKIGSSFRLEWTGSSKDVIIEPTANPLIAQIQIKNTSWHRHLVQLHKAKGGTPFKVYSTILAVALLLLFITGFIMALQLSNLRKMVFLSSTLGFVVFAAMIMSS